MNRITNGDIGTYGLSGVSFGFITDMHHDPAKAQDTNKYYQDTAGKMDLLATAINARTDLSFMFQNGDAIDGSANASVAQTDLATFATSFSQINIPKYHNVGNHELLRLTKAQVYAKTGQAAGYYSFVQGGVTFIVLDGNYTADNDGADRSADGGAVSPYTSFIPPAQRTWLAATLAASPYPCVVICHYPIYYAGLDTSGTWQINNSAAVRSIIDAAGNVILSIGGHVHQNYFAKLSSTTYATMGAFVTGASPLLTYSAVTIYPTQRAFKIVSTGYSESYLPIV